MRKASPSPTLPPQRGKSKILPALCKMGTAKWLGEAALRPSAYWDSLPQGSGYMGRRVCICGDWGGVRAFCKMTHYASLVPSVVRTREERLPSLC